MTEKNIRVLNVIFEETITARELSAFRGAIAGKVGWENEWFHNHKAETGGYHHRYSLLQYKRHHHRPMLLCLENGIEEVQKFFSHPNWELSLNGKIYTSTIRELKVHEFLLRVENEKKFTYTVSHWMPLTRAENFKAYSALDGLVERVNFLEKLLTKHIFAFYKGMGVFPEERVQVSILDIEKQYRTQFRKMSQQAFQIKFKTNAFIPHFVGLGKGVSLGYGIVR